MHVVFGANGRVGGETANALIECGETGVSSCAARSRAQLGRRAARMLQSPISRTQTRSPPHCKARPARFCSIHRPSMAIPMRGLRRLARRSRRRCGRHNCPRRSCCRQSGRSTLRAQGLSSLSTGSRACLAICPRDCFLTIRLFHRELERGRGVRNFRGCASDLPRARSKVPDGEHDRCWTRGGEAPV
jgi:hypothetical protein